MATFVAEGVRIGIFAACARGATSIVADEVRSPRIAATLSCEMNLRAIVAASPGLDPLSSTINSPGPPRTPPLPFVSSTAILAPWILETPKVERAPVKQLTAPILTPASAQQLDARAITLTTRNRNTCLFRGQDTSWKEASPAGHPVLQRLCALPSPTRFLPMLSFVCSKAEWPLNSDLFSQSTERALL